tara:strand:- start:1050 stop:1391 length:342 start_codon:yes stop_codon:yes gene_type:complete
MYEQQWEQVTLHAKKKSPLTTDTIQVKSSGISRATQNVLSDDTLPPEQIDTQRRKKLIALRTHLKLKMDDMSKRCSIPLAEYRDMENGRLIKSKATQHMNKIFRIFKKDLELL